MAPLEQVVRQIDGNLEHAFSRSLLQCSNIHSQRLLVYEHPYLTLPPRRQHTKGTMGGKLRFAKLREHRSFVNLRLQFINTANAVSSQQAGFF
jgi:hypothetical protein